MLGNADRGVNQRLGATDDLSGLVARVGSAAAVGWAGGGGDPAGAAACTGSALCPRAAGTLKGPMPSIPRDNRAVSQRQFVDFMCCSPHIWNTCPDVSTSFGCSPISILRCKQDCWSVGRN